MRVRFCMGYRNRKCCQQTLLELFDDQETISIQFFFFQT